MTRSLSLVSKTVFFDINSRFYVDTDSHVPCNRVLCSKQRMMYILFLRRK